MIAAATLSVAHGAIADPHTVTWSAQNPGAGLGDQAGVELAPGTVVRLGYFAITPEQVAAAFDDVAYLDTQFVEAGREVIGNFGGIYIGNQVEKMSSGFEVRGAFAQTLTLDAESIPEGSRFYVWVADTQDPRRVRAQALFSDMDWQVASEQVTPLQWGIESVHPADAEDVYLAVFGPETSVTVGGKLNKLRAIDKSKVTPGDLEDPDGNGIVVLLEEAFLVDDSTTAHTNLPYMAAADVLVYNRKSGGQATGWDRYRAGDLEYRIEVTSDFRNWQLASEVLGEAAITATALATGGERVALRFAALAALADAGAGVYFRVHVQRIVGG